MEFLILLGICVLIVLGVAWLGRRRQPDHQHVDARSMLRAQQRAADEDTVRWRYGPPDRSGGGASF
jgi:hypothetical protein